MNPAFARRLLAGVAVVLGAIAFFAGEPHPRNDASVDIAALDIGALASDVAHERDHVSARELADWIRSRKAGLRIIDLREPAEFATYHLPGAKQMSIEAAVAARFSAAETIVLVSDGGAHAAQAWVLMRAAGHREVYFLRGGLKEWTDLLESDREIGNYFGRPSRSGQENGGC